MSTARPTVFGGLLFGGDNSSATLFAESFIPQTYSLNLSESLTGTESELFSATKVLNDTITISVADAKVLSHALSDSITASSAIAKTLQKVFADSASISAGSLVFTIKRLADFLVLKEWISIRLTKSLVWTNPSANANLHDTLWGKYRFGTQLFGGVKPVSTWNAGPTKQPSVWTNTDGSKFNY